MVSRDHQSQDRMRGESEQWKMNTVMLQPNMKGTSYNLTNPRLGRGKLQISVEAAEPITAIWVSVIRIFGCRHSRGHIDPRPYTAVFV